MLDAQLSAEDRLALQLFLKGPVGSKVLKSLLVATPTANTPIPCPGSENETLFRSGCTKGWTAAIDHLVRLSDREDAEPAREPSNFPNIDDESAWDGANPRTR